MLRRRLMSQSLPTSSDRLRGVVRLAVVAQVLLVVAGLRHHLAWGESPRLPFSLRPWLDALETGCLVGFVWLGTRAWWRGMAGVDRDAPARRLVWLSVPILLAAMLVPPFLSMDAFDYVMRGRVQALHGGNPYVQVAADFPDDPFVAYGDAAWKSFPLPYGPVLANVQAGVAWLAHWFESLPRPGELIIAVLLFKLLFAAALLASALLARSVAAVLRPGSENRSFVAILWNPLLLAEGVANAHNEPLVLVCLFAALATACTGRAATSVFALGVGVLTKIVPVLLLPLWCVHALRQRRTVACGLGLLATAAFAGVFYWQFFRVEGSLQFLRRQSELQGGSLLWGLQNVTGIGFGTLLTIGRVLVVLLLASEALRLWKRSELEVLVRATAVVLAALVAFGVTLFGPWYHVWWVPVALLLGHGYLYRVACIATVTAPLGYMLWTGFRRLDEPAQWTMWCMGLLVPALGGVLWRGHVLPPVNERAAAG